MLNDCFSDVHHQEWAGFYNRGFPANQEHRHMFWHLKYGATEENHYNMWFRIEEYDLMQEYINRHKDEDVLELLNDLRNRITYACSDPRMHPRAEGDCHKFTKIAFERYEKDFTELEEVTSVTTLVIMDVFLMQRSFTVLRLDTWELVWLLQMTLTQIIDIEVQRPCLSCFGILVIGRDPFSTRNHYRQTWRNFEVPFDQTWTLHTES